MDLLNVTCNNSGVIREVTTNNPYAVFEVTVSGGTFFLMTDRVRRIVDAFTNLPNVRWLANNITSTNDVVDDMMMLCKMGRNGGILTDSVGRVVAYTFADPANEVGGGHFQQVRGDIDFIVNVEKYGDEGYKPMLAVRGSADALPTDAHETLDYLLDYLDDNCRDDNRLTNDDLRKTFTELAGEVPRAATTPLRTEPVTETAPAEGFSSMQARFYLDNLTLVDRVKGKRINPTRRTETQDLGYFIVVDVEGVGEVTCFVEMKNMVDCL